LEKQLLNIFALQMIFITFSFSLHAAPRITFGSSLVFFDYKEILPEPQKSSEAGSFLRVEAAVSTPLVISGSRGYTRFGLSPRVQTQYEGTVLQTNDPARSTNTHTLIDLEAGAMYRFDPYWALSAGVYYENWNRFLSYGSAYREIFELYALPFGVHFAQDKHIENRGLVLGAEIVPQLSSQMKVIFSETIQNGQDDMFLKAKTTGLRFTAQYKFKFGLGIKCIFEKSASGESSNKFNATPGLNSEITSPASQTQKIVIGASFDISL
jgi:hypothetical protein